MKEMLTEIVSEQIKEARIIFDRKGFMIYPIQWFPYVAEFLAKRDGFELTDKHWAIIQAIREYYRVNGNPPTLESLYESVATSCGPVVGAYSTGSCRGIMMKLFPNGPIMYGYRYAGMPYHERYDNPPQKEN